LAGPGAIGKAETAFIPSRTERTLQSEAGKVGKQQGDMIRGTLDMLIMKVLSLGPLHGWGIQERIQLISEDDLQVNQGSLYPALHKLSSEGWVKSYWGMTENNRQARFYRLTRAGDKQLAMEAENWARLATAVARVMATS
jgi:transcriptional regulator